MNLRDLRYLVAVAEHRHFGRAAEACHVSQPTLSTQLKKLEDYLGVVLIERSNRSVEITPVGETVVGHARRALAEAQNIIDTAQQARDPFSGELRIGVIPTVAPFLLPHALPRLAKVMPNLSISLFERQTHLLEADLAAHRIDAAILAIPARTEFCATHALYAEPFLLAVPSRHQLADRKSVTVSDLAGESVLLLEDGHCLRDQALEVCSRVGANEDTNFSATSLETLRQMVMNNAGITLMPSLAADQRSKRIRYVSFEEPSPTRIIGLVWRETSPRQQVMERIVEAVKELELGL